ncbi:START domain-containing protein [Mucilaginibacter koreensis]
MYKKIWIALIACISVLSGFAQQPWQLSTNQDGIKVYTRPVTNSKFKALKVECELNATPTQVAALLLDVDACKDWVYHTKSCTLLKRVSPSELYYYSEVSVPWPAENRDFIAHVIITQNPETKAVTMDAPCVQGMVPVKSGIVRIEHSTGRWTITPAGSNQVKIIYELQVDPGGDIPAWLTNMFATQGPLQSFKALRQQLQKPAYRNARLAFIKEE